MYRGFNLTLDDEERESLANFRPRNRDNNGSSGDFAHLKEKLDGLKLDGTAIKKEWFGNAKADVFLSHAHADQKLALNLADFLHENLGLRTFVDSRVWGNSRELLLGIDDAHCWSEENGFYVYIRRNYSTSHVHMMLATALSEMIDSTECVIFLHTPSSIEARHAKSQSAERTASPWIFHELTMTRLIARKLGRKPPPLPWRASLEERAIVQDAALEILYDAPLAHLCNINGDMIGDWASQSFSRRKDALNWLYENTRPTEEEWPALAQLAKAWEHVP